MRFRPYPKILRRPDLPPPGGPWVATEKIHGANFVVGLDHDAPPADRVRFGKRRAWLAPEEPFFGWQLLAGTLAERVKALAADLGAPRLYLWGELCGGHYPGAPALPGLSAVQTGVWYAPDLRWVVFDALIPDGAPEEQPEGQGSEGQGQEPEDSGTFLAFSALEEAAARAGLEVAPAVGRGSRQEVEAIPADGLTALPARYGLPPLAGNRREGLVLRPDRAMAAGERPVSKKKIADFDELRFQEAEAWSPGWLEAREFHGWAQLLVNPARIAGARSKVGADPEVVAGEVALDVLLDLEAAFPQAFSALSREDLSRLEAEIRRASRAG